jgi:uncharacterized SAM-binding protein YcdF (DUF218 family)
METDKAPHENISDCRRLDTPVSSWSLKLVKRSPRLRLFRRCTIWCPTWVCSLLIASIFLIAVAWWFTHGESFLASTQRLPADVLVVEGWIGRQGIRAAVAEFKRSGYRYIVATGGLTTGRWEDEHASYAEMAGGEMIRSGVPKERVIVATSKHTESHRTFESAVAAWRALRDADIRPKAINVFTFGAHARRSGLVFAKVDSPGTEVGVISWVPPEYEAEPWWRSSERSRELLEETAGYLFEAVLNSGRRSNSPGGNTSADSVQHPKPAPTVATPSLR